MRKERNLKQKSLPKNQQDKKMLQKKEKRKIEIKV